MSYISDFVDSLGAGWSFKSGYGLVYSKPPAPPQKQGILLPDQTRIMKSPEQYMGTLDMPNIDYGAVTGYQVVTVDSPDIFSGGDVVMSPVTVSTQTGNPMSGGSNPEITGKMAGNTPGGDDTSAGSFFIPNWAIAVVVVAIGVFVFRLFKK